MILLNRELTLKNIEDLLFAKETVSLDKEAIDRITRSYEFLKEFSKEKVIYGINTGFGPMSQFRVDDSNLKQLQLNLIRSHAAGTGEILTDLQVKAAMIARLATFVQGCSGVHPSLPVLLAECINRDILPVIPQHGSVGASGDLVQLAHMALALIGEGKVHYHGQTRDAAEVLKENNLEPMQIHIREGLAMTNGTSVMTGIGLLNFFNARKLLLWAMSASALVNEIAGSYDDFLSPVLNGKKRHDGQLFIARQLSDMLSESRCLKRRQSFLYNREVNGDKVFRDKVQPFYSLRCVPQILGPVADTLEYAGRVLLEELNSCCDNPVVDPETENVYHGGNFHGDYVSLEMDKMKTVVTKMTMLMERQLNYICHDKVNQILPPFVNLGIPGLNYGMQAAQFTATSTTAECQTLSMPNYIHSIPNNNDNQDVVSMGTNSGLITARVIENAFQVTSIHLMALAQAVSCLDITEKLSPPTLTVYKRIRGIFPAVKEDVALYPYIAKTVEYITHNKP
ncbi:MAG TPA: aromatic amino acid ammonia-lyase [Bacteroidales bacterium]|jgi:histidine ammonia-lyase|nr:aromatic amino acid lyase [Bacteroidales bacterium]MBP8999469.1 aromatic amino acid lyase [Bacteroidales bacterium]MBV6455632.1 Tyrosine 2,3-aminomutase [Bacteroidales bacterium]MCZ2315911.1 aromatic amino acid ammonia-lyase [Bacteroidales bacterium]NLZ08370.1 aromatic amino acid lyase [Bacteroidales bacterium]